MTRKVMECLNAVKNIPGVTETSGDVWIPVVICLRDFGQKTPCIQEQSKHWMLPKQIFQFLIVDACLLQKRYILSILILFAEGLSFFQQVVQLHNLVRGNVH